MKSFNRIVISFLVIVIISCNSEGKKDNPEQEKLIAKIHFIQSEVVKKLEDFERKLDSTFVNNDSLLRAFREHSNGGTIKVIDQLKDPFEGYQSMVCDKIKLNQIQVNAYMSSIKAASSNFGQFKVYSKLNPATYEYDISKLFLQQMDLGIQYESTLKDK